MLPIEASPWINATLQALQAFKLGPNVGSQQATPTSL